MFVILNTFDGIVQKHPERTAVVHCLGRGRALCATYSEVERRAREVCTYLSGRGVVPGDLVGIYMRRSIDHVAAILGILKTGAGFYSLNPRSSMQQLISSASAASAPTILIDDEALLNLRPTGERSALTPDLVVCSSGIPTPLHERAFADLSARLALGRLAVGNCSEVPEKVIVGQDVALALFTSGSTGDSKGVLISHQDLYNRVLTECEYFSLTSADVLLSLLPFSFDVGANQLFTALATGAQLVILNSWLPADIATVISQHQVTGISGVPAIWAQFLNIEDERIVTAINSVRYITVSGGDLAPNQLQHMSKLFHSTQIFKTYGQSETFRSTILLPTEFRHRMLSVGRPVKGTDVWIVNKKGGRAAAEEAGEIVHRGDGTMMRYLGDSRGTRRKLRGNPLSKGGGPCRQCVVYTGDIGRMDIDGFLYVLGRKDKMIKTSGYRVYPKEVTDQILRHPSIHDAVVFGIPDKTLGSVLYSEIQLKPARNLTEAELRSFLTDRLAGYMIPRKIIFVSAFPRTASGKIRLSEVEGKYRGQG